MTCPRCPRKQADLSPSFILASSPKLDTAILHGFPRARLYGTRKRPAPVSVSTDREQPGASSDRTAFPRTDSFSKKVTREHGSHSPAFAFLSSRTPNFQPIVLEDDRPFFCADTPSRSKYQRRPWQALYSEPEWKEGRRDFLRSHPLCAYCLRYGLKGRPAPQYTTASVVDHVRRHKGDRALFYDRANWQPLCKFHHDSVKQAQERRAEGTTYGEDGWPIQ